MRCCFFLCAVEPGGGSLLAAGSWAPGKNELATIRYVLAAPIFLSLSPTEALTLSTHRARSSHLQHNASRLRQVISAEAFVAHFGEPAPHPKGARRSIFGMEDELKVSPKGIDKTHKSGHSPTYLSITTEAEILRVASGTSTY